MGVEMSESMSNERSSLLGGSNHGERRSTLLGAFLSHELTADEEEQREIEERQRQARMRSQSVYAVPEEETIKGQRNRKNANEYKRDVEYDGENHLAVIFQMYGSVWPAVLPWCFATLLVTAGVWYLREAKIVDLTIASNTGHGFMSILVSFLIVTRTTITYNRFMEARQHLADLYRSSREIVHYTCVLTNQNMSEEAKEWRREVAYRTIVTLRVAVAALEYR